jgi:uncharacterized membrane protein YsdA (DUF1294 family)/cold shock CspA family protein
MRKKGTVIRWDSGRAFGFIRSPDTVADVFFHIRDYSENRHPTEGMVVSFDEIQIGRKGPRALKVEPARIRTQEAKSLRKDPHAVILPRAKVAAPPHQMQRQTRVFWATMGLMALWLLLWITAMALGRVPAIAALSGLLILNLVTFYTYLRDKNAAENGQWRISEKQLHTLALLGGWPGARFAQRRLNHKSSKKPFQVAYWGTVALHTAGLLAWLVWPAFQASM